MTSELMYNTDRKEPFIEYYVDYRRANQDVSDETRKNRRVRASGVFNRLGPIEKNYDKDFCEFLDGSPEMDDVYLRWLNQVTDSFRNVVVPVMKSYVAWCYENGYIDARTYKEHGITNLKNEKSKDLKRSITSKQLNLIEREIEKNYGDFVFADEESFIEYVEVVLSVDKYLMIAVAMILCYYQFEAEEMRNLLKTDVNPIDHTVKGVHITSDKAFDIILRSTKMSAYLTKSEIKANVFYRSEYFQDSVYLLRSSTRGNKKEQEDPRVGATFMQNITVAQKNAAKALPVNSPYKHITITPKNIKKLKIFHEIKKDEETHGTDYMIHQMYDGVYRPAFYKDRGYRQYCLMIKKVKNI